MLRLLRLLRVRGWWIAPAPSAAGNRVPAAHRCCCAAPSPRQAAAWQHPSAGPGCAPPLTQPPPGPPTQGALKARQLFGLLPRDLATCCMGAVAAWEAQALADPFALPAPRHLLEALRAVSAAEDSQVCVFGLLVGMARGAECQRWPQAGRAWLGSTGLARALQGTHGCSRALAQPLGQARRPQPPHAAPRFCPRRRRSLASCLCWSWPCCWRCTSWTSAVPRCGSLAPGQPPARHHPGQPLLLSCTSPAPSHSSAAHPPTCTPTPTCPGGQL
jgi:hypothetical protein